jgi:hypothetical protein
MLMQANWNSVVASVAVAAVAIAAMLTGQQSAALMCVGALCGLLAPPPYTRG